MERKPVGKIMHFFPKISVAVIKADELLKKGDHISIEGNDSKVEMTLESMQIEHKSVDEIKPGEEAGVKTPGAVKIGDKVFKTE